jgi:hypothetical protein
MVQSTAIYIYLLKDRAHFSQKTPQICHFLAQETQMNFLNFIAHSTIGSCSRLLGEHVQKVLQKLTARIVRL